MRAARAAREGQAKIDARIAQLSRKAGAAEHNMNSTLEQIKRTENKTERALLKLEAERFRAQWTQHLKAIATIQAQSALTSATVSTAETVDTLYPAALLMTDLATPQTLHELEEVQDATTSAGLHIKAADRRTKRISRSNPGVWGTTTAEDEDALLGVDAEVIEEEEEEEAEEEEKPSVAQRVPDPPRAPSGQPRVPLFY